MNPTFPPWFVFLLDDELLEKNRPKLSSNKQDAIYIISLFLHHADVLAASSHEEAKEKEGAWEGCSRRVKKLRLMALKVASLLHWNMPFLSTHLSAGKVQTLLLTLLHVSCGASVYLPFRPHPSETLSSADDDAGGGGVSSSDGGSGGGGSGYSSGGSGYGGGGGSDGDYDDDQKVLMKLDPQAIFALVLYHTWCLGLLVEGNMPCKPHKLKSQIPAFVDPLGNSALSKEQVIKLVRDNEEKSAAFVNSLLHLLQRQQQNGQQPALTFLAPSFDTINTSFTNTSTTSTHPSVGEGAERDVDDDDDDERGCHDWSKGIHVPYLEMSYHINWVSATHGFLKGNYHQSLYTFNSCQKILPHIKAATFVEPQVAHLHGFLKACSGVAKLPSTTTMSPQATSYERLKICLKEDMNGVLELLMEDLLTREWSVSLRQYVQAVVPRQTTLHHSIILCNELRAVLGGKGSGLSSSFLLFSHPHLSQPLVKMCSNIASSLPPLDQKHLKRHLLTLSLSHDSVASLVATSQPLRPFFSQQELTLLFSPSSSLFPSSSSYFSFSSSTPNQPAPPSKPPPPSTPLLTTDILNDLLYISEDDESSDEQAVGSYNLRRGLEVSGEVDALLQLATQVHLRHWNCRSFVSHFFEQWRLSSDLVVCLSSLNQLRHVSILVHVVIFKSRKLLLMGRWRKADQMLHDLEGIVRGGKLNKLIKNQLLANQLIHRIITSTTTEDKEVMVKKCMQCILPSPQDANELKANVELVTLALSYLLDEGELEMIYSFKHDNDPLFMVAQLLVGVARDVPKGKAHARSLISIVAQLFSATGAAKKAKIVTLTTDLFLSFVFKIKDATIIDIIISCLCRLFRMADLSLNDDLFSFPSPSLSSLWPSSLSCSPLDREGIVACLQQVLRHATTTNPHHLPPYRTSAELCYALREHRSSMQWHMQAAMWSSECFVLPVTKEVLDDQAYRRMIQSCMAINFYTVAAVLCQYVENVDYGTCLKCLQEACPCDPGDLLYPFLTHVCVLEFVINLHHRTGAIDRRNKAVELMSRLDNNSHNSSDVTVACQQRRQSAFFVRLSRLLSLLRSSEVAVLRDHVILKRFEVY